MFVCSCDDCGQPTYHCPLHPPTRPVLLLPTTILSTTTICLKPLSCICPTEKDEPKTSSVASVFPWLPLSSSDRQILSATNSRLQSHGIILVARSSEFLCDVLFKDFPPEIFLQRPAIVQVKCFQLINGNDAEMSHPKLCWYVICPIFTVFQFPHDSYL